MVTVNARELLHEPGSRSSMRKLQPAWISWLPRTTFTAVASSTPSNDWVSGSTMLTSVFGTVTPADPGLNMPTGVAWLTGDSSVMP